MVIKCPKCNSRFKLPIDRVRPGGLRVRCAECQHIFPIWPTETADQSPSTKDATSNDLWDESLNAAEQSPPETMPETTSALPQAPASTDDQKPGLSESDLGLDDLGQSPASASGTVFSEQPEPEEGFDEFGFEEESVIGNPFAESGEKPLRAEEFFPDQESTEDMEGELPEFSFEKAGLKTFSFDMDEQDTVTDSQPVVNSFFPTEMAKGEKTDLFSSPLAPPPAADATGKSADSADRFDFNMSFGASPRSEQNSSWDDTEDIVIGRLGKSKSAGQRQTSSDTEVAANSYQLSETQKRRGPIATVLRFFFILFLLLGGIMGYLFWKNDTTDINQIWRLVSGNQPTESQGSRIRLPLPKSFYIKNRNVGQLFVIRGEAVNGYPEARSAIAVKGMLHDEEGKVLLQQTVFCGNSMDQETLRTASFAKLEANMNNQFGNTLSNLNVEPGKAIPYMIVFRNLPPNVTEFTVEVADSKAGVTQ